jgi:cellulose synthase operon protein C
VLCAESQNTFQRLKPIMLLNFRRLAPGFLLVLTLLLAGCQSSEEKAEAYYQSGLELLQEGDEDRALVEFRNVFKYNGFHKEARKTYADTLVKRGELGEAYSQYLRLIEQYPDTVDVRMTLAEMSFDAGSWDEFARHGQAVVKLAPDLPRVKAISLALDYNAALLARDNAKQAEAVSAAEKLQADLPDSSMLRRVIIDFLMKGADPQAAKPQIDAALKLTPKDAVFQYWRLRLLALAQDNEGLGAQLQTMVALFPENEELKSELIRWYLAKQDFAGAETFLRAQAGEDTAEPKGHLAVVQLLNTTKDRAAGRTELERLIAANAGQPNADLYGSFLATMSFEDGKTAEAIKALDTILAQAKPSDQTRSIMGIQARMLDKTGAHDKAVAIVAQILADDASNVEALKLRASWAVAENRTGEAIVDLRAAQGQAPRDPQIMTLMASAYEREGSTDLAGEQLSKAYEAAAGAPDEALRYAGFLRGQGRAQVAETVLTDARRVSPTSIPVLQALASVLLENKKWPQVTEIAETLRQLATPEAVALASQLQASVLMGQERLDEGLALLETQADATETDASPSVVVALTQLRAGKVTEARSFLDEALKKFPQDRQLRLISANVDAMQGKPAEAEAAFRALIAEDAQDERPVRLLYGLLTGADRKPDARKVLDAGIAAQPKNETLLWIKAGLLEQEGDIDGAIAIYEQLYSTNSGNIVVSNNLASMITSYRDDAASLDRAATIARRLRNSDVPQFQDTYGWIEYRRGNLDNALPSLEAAAKGLPDDAVAQFHLGMLYADLGRKDEAVTQLNRAITLGQGSAIPQVALAQEKLKELAATP